METDTAIDTASAPPTERHTPTGPPSVGPDGGDGGRVLRPAPGPSSPALTEGRSAQVDGRGDATRLTVRAWWDPELARHGVDPRDDYVERFWLGLVGPSTVLLLRRLARGLELHPAGFRIATADTARALGLGPGGGRNGPLNRTIDRACTFGLARRTGEDELLVRTHLPLLNRRQLARLPTVVRTAHEDWVRTRDAPPPAA